MSIPIDEAHVEGFAIGANLEDDGVESVLLLLIRDTAGHQTSIVIPPEDITSLIHGLVRADRALAEKGIRNPITMDTWLCNGRSQPLPCQHDGCAAITITPYVPENMEVN